MKTTTYYLRVTTSTQSNGYFIYLDSPHQLSASLKTSLQKISDIPQLTCKKWPSAVIGRAKLLASPMKEWRFKRVPSSTFVEHPGDRNGQRSSIALK